MPDKTSDRLTTAEQSFKTLLLERYELESDFVDSICDIFSKVVEPLLETGTTSKRTRTASSKAKKPRKKSAYNVFVREMMKTDDIKELDHKQKMGAIAKLWKDLDASSRSPYTDMANDENASSEPTEE